MASPSTVITLGYGSFGSVNLLPTLGYGTGITETPGPGTDYTPDATRAEYTLTGTRTEFTLTRSRTEYTLSGP